MFFIVSLVETGIIDRVNYLVAGNKKVAVTFSRTFGYLLSDFNELV